VIIELQCYLLLLFINMLLLLTIIDYLFPIVIVRLSRAGTPVKYSFWPL